MNILPARAAMATGLTVPFGAVGGTPPYSFQLLSGAGSIDPLTGIYTSPAAVPRPTDPIIEVEATDASGEKETAEIFVGTPLELFCDVLQTGLGLSEGRVYLYDQKISKPNDHGLFVAVGVLSCRPFSNSRTFDSANNAEVLSTNFLAQLSVDIISRGTEARDRKEEVLLALGSIYAEQQQELNSFKIGQIPSGFMNLSEIDGSAIPYRFNIVCTIQYFVQKTNPVGYFDTFQDPAITVDP